MECSPLLKQALNDWVSELDVPKVPDLPSGTKNSLANALQEFKDTGRTHRFWSMNPRTKQAVINTLFSSRKLEEVKGNVMTKGDVDYFGFTTKMGPLDYLRLALKRSKGRIDREKGDDFAANILTEVIERKKPRLGTPLLIVTIDDSGKLVVKGHEGRHRSNAIYSLFGKDVDIPVDIKFTDEIRRRHLDETVLDKELVNQDGYSIGATLRDLLSHK